MALELNDPVVTDETIWRKRAEAVLKGADFGSVLTSKTADGLRIEPLYPKVKGNQPLIGREAGSPWSIMSRIDDQNQLRANTQALTDLENGSTGLALVFENAIGSYGFGLPTNAETVVDVLKGIYLDAGIDIALDCGPRGRDAARAFSAACTTLGFPANTVRVRFGLNPIGLGARDGIFPADGRKISQNIAAGVSDLIDQSFAGPFVAADGRVIHNAGGSEAQELGFVLANALFYLRALELGGLSLEEARGMIEFRLSSDADQFLSIAKHRALRRLWSSIEVQCGLQQKPIFLTSETAYRMMALRDPYVNILRSGMGCFGAVIGGADAITVLPFTTPMGLADPFARRLSRNTNLILLEESHLAKVIDPVAGAGGYETLTNGLVTEGWNEFQRIEAEGGIVSSLTLGTLQARVAAKRTSREELFVQQKSVMVGVNSFLNDDEKSISVLAPTPALSKNTDSEFTPLFPGRLSEAFESNHVQEGREP